MSRPIHNTLLVAIAAVLLLFPLAAWISHESGSKPAALQRIAAETESADGEAADQGSATVAGTETTAPAETETTGAEHASPVPTDKAVVMLGGGPDKIKLTEEERQFVELVNKERRARDISELTVAPLLVQTARAKSREMCDLNYWGHESPDKKRRTAMYRLLDALPEQPKTMLVGENLYFCTEVLVESGHKALMNSPTHRKNILNPEYKYIGIGAYIAKDKRFWVTEHFLKIDY